MEAKWTIGYTDSTVLSRPVPRLREIGQGRHLRGRTVGRSIQTHVGVPGHDQGDEVPRKGDCDPTMGDTPRGEKGLK